MLKLSNIVDSWSWARATSDRRYVDGEIPVWRPAGYPESI